MNPAISNLYKKIYSLVAEIKRLRIAEQLIETAKENNPEKLCIVFSNIKMTYSVLWNNLSDFYLDYTLAGRPIIFCDKDYRTDDLYLYNPHAIDPQALTMLIMFSNHQINESDLFANYYNLIEILRDSGHLELSFIMTKCYCSTINALIEAFK